MLTGQQYLELVNDRGQRGLELKRVYRNVRREDLLMGAYNKLYANKGATTPGPDPRDTVDGMSMEIVRGIAQDLKDGTYRWKPNRRTYIRKARPQGSRKLRPLGIPCWRDKMVQEVLRSILEAYYEPQFSDSSHGFRPQRGCHTALKEIVFTWRGTKWFIEGDIRGCFDHIDHRILLEIVAQKVQDVFFIKLLRQMLKAGYLEDFRYNNTMSGTGQGGVVSPLLANIYLDRFDKFVEHELLPRYNRGERRGQNPEYGRLLSLQYRLKKAGHHEEAKTCRKTMQRLPSVDPMDPNYRRLRYVRYADDFLLGFAGPKREAIEIKQAIGQFLQEQLKLEMAEEKTLITHAATNPARFLGYNIHIDWDNTYQTNGKRVARGLPQLRIPQDVQWKWLRSYMKKGKPTHRAELTHMTDYDITMLYESQLRGLANYYTMAVNVGRLHRLKYVMMESLVKTLANKHKTGKKTIYKKYSTVFDTGMKGLQVELERSDKPNLVARFGSRPIRYQRVVTELKDERWMPYLKGRSQLSDRLMADHCELCGRTENIEVHHIRKLKDLQTKYYRKNRPRWVARMIAIRRKTLVLCRKCHLAIHNGTYDGKAISSRKAE
jgi:group II intron reverse transcriptase/maturase